LGLSCPGYKAHFIDGCTPQKLSISPVTAGRAQEVVEPQPFLQLTVRNILPWRITLQRSFSLCVSSKPERYPISTWFESISLAMIVLKISILHCGMHVCEHAQAAIMRLHVQVFTEYN
jgi:hypothetical protein